LLKLELGFTPGFEFHFNKVKGTFREAFRSAAAGYGFFYFSIVIRAVPFTALKMTVDDRKWP
jgi:hypothetical protein